MTPPSVDRRTLLKGAAAATAALALPRAFDPAAAAAPASRGIFGYGVASGDPTADSVIIWTRATPPARPGEPVATPGSGLGRPIPVRWQVARDRDFTRLAAHGTVMTSPDSDHTVKIDVTGLDPYTRYWYRFQSLGEFSEVGRTQTAGDIAGEVHALRLALVSCSNYTGGYFTAYRAIADRNDLDFVLHVGDYIYEYGNGADRYGPAALIGVRDGQPATETIDLLGYRLRHALHKADPDAQKAHRKHPWITIFDDHEVANNAWADGAENHQSPEEGDYLQRRAQAMQAYLEWMPFRLPDQSVPHQGTRFFKRFTYGALGDLSILETRQNRSRQVTVPNVPFDGFVPVGIDPAIDGAIASPLRHLPEPEQMTWLQDGLAEEGRTWHLLGNQVMISPVLYPGAALGAPGLTFVNADQWDGYTADRTSLLTHAAAQASSDAGDAVVLTGDIHASFACDLPVAARPGSPAYTSAGVEFVCPSVTSDGFFEVLSRSPQLAGSPPEVVVAVTNQAIGAAQLLNPWIRWIDGVRHGFTVIDVTPERVQADYHHTPAPTSVAPDPRVDAAVVPTYARSFQTLAGSRRVSLAAGPVGPRSDQPAGA
ncbi:alkaline phosphatase [Intrasporangium oryzae NRRL B-24470]|uniref:Alkaline phosphatase n=1 Tax=Intrasporangium oryzae NRRL B-24470 TaxID=1386089 RepID=W9GEV3_9MICO|nr:alkaline phosphatase D family protein [Intrasporangium oryzae]EWT03358.1 alkaline phosphatase [Intrasporangium oryzae NRRL B-24470]